MKNIITSYDVSAELRNKINAMSEEDLLSYRSTLPTNSIEFWACQAALSPQPTLTDAISMERRIDISEIISSIE